MENDKCVERLSLGNLNMQYKMDLKDVGYERLDWIHKSWDMVHSWALVSMVYEP
jgi:hypothetical protein